MSAHKGSKIILSERMKLVFEAFMERKHYTASAESRNKRYEKF